MQEFASDRAPALSGLPDRTRDGRAAADRAKACPTRRSPLALGVAEKTVKTHVSNILQKLHLADRTQAALYAVRERLVDLD